MQKLSKLEKEIEADVKIQLHSLLSEMSALAVLSQVFPSPRVKKALYTLRETQSTLIDLEHNLIGKQKTLLDAVAYLFWVEVSTNLLADITIIMFATKGQPFHIEPDDRYRFIRHVASIEDLESPSVTLAVKLDFLDKSGFSCFNKYVDRTLRNKIAHMDFEIDEKGNFSIHEKKNGEIRKKQVDIHQKLNRLTFFNSVFMHEIKLSVDKAKKKVKSM